MQKVKSPNLWCRLFGCKTFGEYYGMPQAYCRRCGMRTGFARPDLPLFKRKEGNAAGEADR